MISLSLILSYLAITAVATQLDPTCPGTQQRPANAPSSSTISQALQQVLSTPKNGPCSNEFHTLSNGSKSNRAQRSTGSLVLEVVKDTANIQIDHQSCVDAFASIIQKCVDRGTYWGGNLTSSNVQYAIYNKAPSQNWTPDSSSPARQHSSSARHPSASALHPHISPSLPKAIVYDAKSLAGNSRFSTRTSSTALSLTASPPPSPPPSPAPTISTPPVTDCVYCESTCIGLIALCTAVCLFLDPSTPNAASNCGNCIAAAKFPANKYCVSCVPQCPRSKENGGLDCTDKDFFIPCTNSFMGDATYPGLCTIDGYERQDGSGANTCQDGQRCDLSVSGTKSCLPPPMPKF